MEICAIGSRQLSVLNADAPGAIGFSVRVGSIVDLLSTASGRVLLAFQPEDLKRDGDYRKLRVELKNAPRGTKVVHRAGYYATP